MTLSEILLLVQDIILVGTGAVVLWYTVETRRLRRAADNQTALLAQQLKLVEERQATEALKEIQYIQPLFQAAGSTQTGAEAKVTLRNKGGPIKDLEILFDPPLRGKLQRSKLLDNDEQVTIEVFDLPSRQAPDASFTIAYTDRLGHRRKQKLRYIFETGELESRNADA